MFSFLFQMQVYDNATLRADYLFIHSTLVAASIRTSYGMTVRRVKLILLCAHIS